MTWNSINVIPKVFWLDNLFYSFTSRKTQLLSVNKGLIHQQSKLLYKELQGMSRSALIEMVSAMPQTLPFPNETNWTVKKPLIPIYVDW